MLEIPTELIELSDISIGNYDFSLVKIDNHYFIELEDLLFVTLFDDAFTTQLLGLMYPPKGYHSLVYLKNLYQDVTDEDDEVTYLIKTPFVECHGSIALIELAIQEKPENEKLLEIESELKEAFEFEAVDEEIVKYILENPWLEKNKKR